jgi:hypothetical protein
MSRRVSAGRELSSAPTSSMTVADPSSRRCTSKGMLPSPSYSCSICCRACSRVCCDAADIDDHGSSHASGTLMNDYRSTRIARIDRLRTASSRIDHNNQPKTSVPSRLTRAVRLQLSLADVYQAEASLFPSTMAILVGRAGDTSFAAGDWRDPRPRTSVRRSGRFARTDTAGTAHD